MLKLVAAAGVLMALAGTAFAMRSQVGELAKPTAERRPEVTSPNDSPRSVNEPSRDTHSAAGPDADARELKFAKDPKVSAKHKPHAKARTKAKATSPHRS